MKRTRWAMVGSVMVGCAMFAATARAQDAPSTHGFSVVLLLGEGTAGAPLPSGLADGARKALSDMKDFLPYKSYRLLDDQWIVANEATVKTTTRLRGVDGQSLQLELRAQHQQSRRIAVVFHLADGRAPDAASIAGLPPAAAIRAEIPTIEADIAKMLERYGAQHPAVVSRQAELKRAQAMLEAASNRPAPLIDTQFSLAVGETVVVGTSRVAGDNALIVLLTAVPRGGPSTTANEARVYVSGFVKNQGAYLVAEGTTVAQAIVLAGGLAERGSDRGLTIRRLVDGQPTTVPATLDTRLMANDTLRVAARP
jgi:hypothetical protein